MRARTLAHGLPETRRLLRLLLLRLLLLLLLHRRLRLYRMKLERLVGALGTPWLGRRNGRFVSMRGCEETQVLVDEEWSWVYGSAPSDL